MSPAPMNQHAANFEALVEERRAPASVVVYLSLLLLVSLSVSCSSQSVVGSDKSHSNDSAVPAPSALPIAVQVDTKLAQALDPLLDSPEFSGRWGVAVMSLQDGKLIYERNSDKLFTPASNMKVYTTAVALDLLGAEYRWRTSVYAEAAPESDGTINGDLVLYGRGAPDLVAANSSENLNSLEELALALVKRGVKHIRGNVIGDESYFRCDPVGEGWQWNDLQWYFGAEASALSVNGNSTAIQIMPPARLQDRPTVLSTESDGYVQVMNNIATVERGGKFRIGIHRGFSDNNVDVWGEFPFGSRGYGVNLAVHRPALWSAQLFLRSLKARGITVDGVAASRDWRQPAGARFSPEGKHELAFVIGKTLAEIVKVTNKESVNLYAELLLRTLGRERGALLTTQEPGGRERGDDESGADIVRLWLSRAGIESGGLAIHDGSGLSRLNLVSPIVTVRLLEVISHRAGARILQDSLPVAGTDGTLQGRMKQLSGKLAAKTGALSYDNALSGYLTTNDGQVFAFSIICNDFVGHSGAIRLIDKLATAMNDSLNPPSPTKR